MASPNSTSEEAEDFHSKISFILPSPWYFQSHTAPVNSIATVNSNEIFTGSRDGTIRQFKRTNSPLPESISWMQMNCFAEHTSWVSGVVWSQADQRLFSGGHDSLLKVWNPANTSTKTSELSLRAHSDYIKALSWSQTSKRLTSVGLDGIVAGWDLAQGSRVGGVRVKQAVYCVASIPQWSLVAFGAERKVKIWDPRSNIKYSLFGEHNNVAKSILLSPDDRWCISGGSDGLLIIWDLRQRQKLCTFSSGSIQEGFSGSVWSLVSEPNFEKLWIGDRDGNITQCDITLNSPTKLSNWKNIHRGSGSVLFSNLLFGDSNSLSNSKPITTMTNEESTTAAATTTTTIQQEGEKRQQLEEKPHENGITENGISKPQQSTLTPFLFVAGGEGTVSVIDINNNNSVESICHLSAAAITKFKWTNRQNHVLSSDRDGNLTLWNIPSGKRLKEFRFLEAHSANSSLTRESFLDVKLAELNGNEMIAVPKWCSIDENSNPGCMTIQLQAPGCFAAEVAGIELEVSKDPELKVNLGGLTIKSLFFRWIAARQHQQQQQQQTQTKTQKETQSNDSAQQQQQQTNTLPPPSQTATTTTTTTTEIPTTTKQQQNRSLLGFPGEIPIILTDDAGDIVVWRKTISELHGNEHLPKWIETCLLKNLIPVVPNDTLVVVVAPDSRNPPDKGVDQTALKLTTRRSAKMKHIVGFLLKKYPQFSEEHLELWCEGKPLPLEMTAYTARTFFCKNQDLQVFFYNTLKPTKNGEKNNNTTTKGEEKNSQGSKKWF